MAYKGLYSENSNPNTHDGQSEATFRTIGCTVTERVAEAMKEYFQFETVEELEDEINKKIETISIKR